MVGCRTVIPGRIAILGAGVSGRAAALAALRSGVTVQVFDERFGGALQLDEATEVEVVTADTGAELSDLVQLWDPDVVVTSPGISPRSELRRGLGSLPVWSEIELAWVIQESSESRGRPWLMITGTNGKTTTVGLLTSILRAAGLNVAEVGNVGLPITSQVAGNASVFAVEVSSFQLEDSYTLCPQAAVCLNVEADHLDWHGHAAAYGAAKAKVYSGVTGSRLYFAGDTVVERMARHAERAELSKLLPLRLAKPLAGEIGVADSWIVDARNGASSTVANLDEVRFFVNLGRPASLLQDILAAAALSLVHGVSSEAIQAGLNQFQPDAHRGTLVGHHGSIRWVDNSKATNAHAALTALKDLQPGTAVWVAGGDGKGQDFDELVSHAKHQLRAVVLIGTDREPLRRALYHHSPQTPIVEVTGAGTPEHWMGDVVAAAARHASAGDTVILAPACASWDQFDDYTHRGEVFAHAVAKFIDAESAVDGAGE